MSSQLSAATRSTDVSVYTAALTSVWLYASTPDTDAAPTLLVNVNPVFGADVKTYVTQVDTLAKIARHVLETVYARNLTP
jgi:hypothetical protein